MECSPPRVSLVLLLGPIAFAIALGGGGACVRSARGPPLPIHIALERAHQALCSAAGAESPRALVARLPPAEPCRAGDARARVRCYLALSDTSVEVARVDGGVRFRVAIPQLSDHVHEVTVRRLGGALAVELESRN